MTVTIIGAGLAGLIAGNMLRHRQASIIEKQVDLPNNHSAVLRFRSSIVGDVTGVPFRRVQMIKAVAPWKNPVADALAYSLKNTGRLASDRSINAGTVVAERFIAPPNLISRLAAGVRIQYDTTPRFMHPLRATPNLPGHAYISTMPMPALMEALDYPHRDEAAFTWTPGANVVATLGACDAYVSLMVPDPSLPFSRVSITGNELIIECPGKSAAQIDTYGRQRIMDEALYLLGIGLIGPAECQIKDQRYAKIVPIDEDARRQFMFWATDTHNVFSLGRFATWRPGLMLDDLVQDVRRIEGWMNNAYAIKKERS